jgi:predicted DNA binding CopG/RHH family protein
MTIRVEEEVIDYFKSMSSEANIPYQSLINLYLRDCVQHHRKIDIAWKNNTIT